MKHMGLIYHSMTNYQSSAVDAGADICTQSTHKILGSMTQMSVIHVNSDRVDVEKVKQILSFTTYNFSILSIDGIS